MSWGYLDQSFKDFPSANLAAFPSVHRQNVAPGAALTDAQVTLLRVPGFSVIDCEPDSDNAASYSPAAIQTFIGNADRARIQTPQWAKTGANGQILCAYDGLIPSGSAWSPEWQIDEPSMIAAVQALIAAGAPRHYDVAGTDFYLPYDGYPQEAFDRMTWGKVLLSEMLGLPVAIWISPRSIFNPPQPAVRPLINFDSYTQILRTVTALHGIGKCRYAVYFSGWDDYIGPMTWDAAEQPYFDLFRATCSA